MLIGRPKSEIRERAKQIRNAFARLDTDILRLRLFEKQNGICLVCNTSLQGWDDFLSHLDHMVPVTEWAQYHIPIEDAIQHVNSEANFALLHSHCNIVKHDRDMEEFLNSRSGDIVIGSRTSAEVEALRQIYLKAYAKMSAASKGKPKSPEHAAAISAAKKGKPFSPEHAAAIREAQARPEYHAKMSAARKGKPHSPARRAAMCAAWIRRRERSATIQSIPE